MVKIKVGKEASIMDASWFVPRHEVTEELVTGANGLSSFVAFIAGSR